MSIKNKFTAASVLAGAVALFTVSGAPSMAQGMMQDWYKVCNKQDGLDVCYTTSSVLSETGQPLTAIRLIEVSGKQNQKRLSVLVPTGRFIPAGVMIKVDNGKEKAIPYTVCTDMVCSADDAFDDALINSMKKGTTLTLTSVNFRMAANPIEIPLKGFSQAFTGPGMREQDVRAEEEKLQKALDAKAQKFNDKMRAEQEKARAAE